MRWFGRLALAALALAPVAASGDSSPRVVLATPGIGAGAVERFSVRFSKAMVPLGDPRAAAPIAVECATPGEGRWVDQATFVWAFATPLPGGTRCSATIVDGLTSTDGFAFAGTRDFTIEGGGPRARSVLPRQYGGEVEEDQLFLVAANAPVIPASVAANAYCAVDGIGERIPVDIAAPATVAKLIGDLGTDEWSVQSFLADAGMPQGLPAGANDRRTAMSRIVGLKCRRPLPPGRDMAIVWGADIAAPGGQRAGTEQRFDFTVRKPFTARFECARVNPQAGCSPVEPAWIRFTAPIARSAAEAIRITVDGGRSIAPILSDEDKRRATISDIRFDAPLPVNAAARLTLPADIRDESGRALVNAERFPLSIRFDEAPPLVKFAADFGILEAKEGGVLPVTVRNVEPALAGRTSAVRGQSLRIDGSDGTIAEWMRRVKRSGETRIDDVRRGGETVRVNNTGATPLLSGDAGAPFRVNLPGKGKAFEVVGIPLTKPGFYVVELASPRLGAALLGRQAPRYVTTAALVTNLSVHFKWGRQGSLAWVTALDSGKPVAGAAVQVTDSCTGRMLGQGRSDTQGRVAFRTGLPEPETYASCEPSSEAHALMVSARIGDDFSFTTTDWGEGIRPYDFDQPYGWSAPSDLFHTVFDRTLVRQGEAVHMKHFLRTPTASGFGVPAGFAGKLVVSHRGSDTQFELPVRIAGGTGETLWNVPQGAPMGDYGLQLVDGDRTLWSSQSIRVDEYRLPTMKASVSGPKEPPVRPRNVPVDLFVGYLSGGGASNLPVDVRVGYQASTDRPKGYENYTFGGRAIAEGTRPLNGEGEEDETPLPAGQTLPVTLGADGTARTSIELPQAFDRAVSMLVEMDYADANGEILTASRSIAINPAAIRLGIRTDGWLMKEDDLRLRLVTLDVDGNPVAGRRVSVALYSREILTARRRLIGGFYAYNNQVRVTKLSGGCSATSDAQGLAQCALDPGVSGEVYAVATVTDDAGNTATAVTSAWLAGEDEWWFGGDNGDRMDVIPERQEYKAGETARFQVRMPFRAATALVTVEREGVIASFVAELSGKDPVVEVPMPVAYSPEVYVSVMAVRGRVGGWRHWLAGWARSIGLDWFGGGENARPTATVDLAKPAYRMGIARVKVGWEGRRLQVAVKADRERYAARDTAQVQLAVAGPDGKPAPQADVAFVAVDEALLQLSPNDSWDLLGAMMGERTLAVLTSTAQTQVVGKRHYGRKALAAGGGGGGDLSGLNREDFQPVLLWRGRVPLDAQGHARVAVPLSDALSGFRLVAIASTKGAFGTGEASVRTAQDLSIFAGVPPLVRTGDRFAAGFTLRNGSDRPMTVEATVALSPRIADGKPIRVTIPAGGAAPVAWNLTAPAMPGTLEWQVAARSTDGRAVDRMTFRQQVTPAVPVEAWASVLSRVGTAGPIAIAAPAGALPGLGDVQVVLSDTLAPPLAGVRDYMTAYPYTCFEQRLSKAVALGDAGAWNRLAGELPAYQAPDGLLRYFPSDAMQGSEALTAYTLSITSEAGLAIPAAARARMIEGLTAVINGRTRNENYGDVRLQRVAAFAALARAGAATPAMLGQLGIGMPDMPTALLADHVAALGRVAGLANAAELRAAGEAELRRRLVYEGSRVDLSDASASPWWLMSSTDEGAIKALLATLGRPGWQDDGPRMMVGIAARQQRGRWDTTPANAWGTILARRFQSLYPAQDVAGITTATLGQQVVRRQWPLDAGRRSLTLALPTGRAPLTLAQAGGAGPWATVTVRAAVPVTRPLTAGYRMTRKVDVVQARTPGRLTRGDVVRVTIAVDADAERNWVVVNDPVPGGATVIGGMANQSAMLAEGEGGDGVQPSYVERGNDAWRAYYAWVPRGRFTVSYTMRLNGAGTFAVPGARVEAMYSPAIRAQLPGATMTVGQR